MKAIRRCGYFIFIVAVLCTPNAVAQTTQQWAEQAAAALQKEDYGVAATALEAYLAQNPQDYRAQFNLALSYSSD